MEEGLLGKRRPPTRSGPHHAAAGEGHTRDRGAVHHNKGLLWYKWCVALMGKEKPCAGRIVHRSSSCLLRRSYLSPHPTLTSTNRV